MEQAFRYKKKLITQVMKRAHGIKNVDISDFNQAHYTINNIIDFLSLNGLIHATNVSSYSFNDFIDFTLKKTDSTTLSQFQEAIKKFQAHFENYSPATGAQEIEELINNIKKIILTFPDNHDIIIGLTDKSEALEKANFDLPEYWHYMTPVDRDYCRPILDYFKRKGYEDFSYGEGENFYVFAKPKEIVVKEEINKKGCLSVIVLLAIIVFLITTII